MKYEIDDKIYNITHEEWNRLSRQIRAGSEEEFEQQLKQKYEAKEREEELKRKEREEAKEKERKLLPFKIMKPKEKAEERKGILGFGILSRMRSFTQRIRTRIAERREKRPILTRISNFFGTRQRKAEEKKEEIETGLPSSRVSRTQMRGGI